MDKYMNVVKVDNELINLPLSQSQSLSLLSIHFTSSTVQRFLFAAFDQLKEKILQNTLSR